MIEYTYDADGNRYSKRVGGSTTRYHYDGDGNILAETDQTGSVKVKYIRDTGGKAVSMIQGAHTYYMIYNAHGDVVALTDENGSTVATYTYDEFGQTTSETGTVYNPLRYAAAHNSYYDAETGFYKMGVRYYDANIGRWTTRDILDYDLRKPQTHNKYAFAENNPTTRVDPTGGYSVSVTAAADGNIVHRYPKTWKTLIHQYIEKADNAFKGTTVDFTVVAYKQFKSYKHTSDVVALDEMIRNTKWDTSKGPAHRALIGYSGAQRGVVLSDGSISLGLTRITENTTLVFKRLGFYANYRTTRHEMGHMYPWWLPDDTFHKPDPYCIMNRVITHFSSQVFCDTCIEDIKMTAQQT